LGELVGARLGVKPNGWASIRLLSSGRDVQQLPCEAVQKEIEGVYSTALFVLLTGGKRNSRPTKQSLKVLSVFQIHLPTEYVHVWLSYSIDHTGSFAISSMVECHPLSK
jgi:hypothetical protein